MGILVYCAKTPRDGAKGGGPVPRYDLLEKIVTIFSEQGFAVHLERDGANPEASDLFMEMGSGMVSGYNEPFPLHMFFLNGKEAWDEIRFDVLRIHGVLFDKLSMSAMDRLAQTLSCLEAQAVGPFLSVDVVERRVVYRCDLVLTKPPAPDAFLSQLDALIMMTVLQTAIQFPVLYDVAYNEMDSLTAVEDISAAARVAQAVTPR